MRLLMATDPRKHSNCERCGRDKTWANSGVQSVSLSCRPGWWKNRGRIRSTGTACEDGRELEELSSSTMGQRKILVVSALLRVLYRIGCSPSFTRSPHVMLLHAPELRCEQRLPTIKVFLMCAVALMQSIEIRH